jgi:hypothetical protein
VLQCRAFHQTNLTLFRLPTPHLQIVLLPELAGTVNTQLFRFQEPSILAKDERSWDMNCLYSMQLKLYQFNCPCVQGIHPLAVHRPVTIAYTNGLKGFILLSQHYEGTTAIKHRLHLQATITGPASMESFFPVNVRLLLVATTFSKVGI